MSRLKVTDFFTYRWRYPIGFTVITGLLVVLLATAGLFIPGGVSENEMTSATTSYQLSSAVLGGTTPDAIIHAPYYALQKVSIYFLGVSPLSIKLPSLVLAFISIFILYGLLQLWFRRNVAVIASVIVVTTGQFLLSAQSGTPDISYLFLNGSLLFFASMLSSATRLQPLWIILLALTAGISLYAPLELYVVASLALTCLIHPHARFIVFRQPIWVTIVSAILFGVTILPLFLAIVNQPNLIQQLLGIPSDLTMISWQHAQALVDQYVGWQPRSGQTIQPAFGMPLLLLAALGLYRLFSAKYTAKSYIITIWAIFLVPLVALQYSAINFTFLPIILLVAFAIDFLIHNWYRLFPHNPYARAAGLVPLMILVVSLTMSNVERFMYGYHYDPTARVAYSHDITLADNALRQQVGPVTLVVDSKHLSFYRMYAQLLQRDQLITVTDSLTDAQRQPGPVLVNATHASTATFIPDTIIVDSTSTDAARFYLYKNGLR